jgi:hypothetical protein
VAITHRLVCSIPAALVCRRHLDGEAGGGFGQRAGEPPEQAAEVVLDLVLSSEVDPAAYGALVRFGEVLPWRGGTPPRAQEALVIP